VVLNTFVENINKSSDR